MFKIADKTLESRLLLGSASYPSPVALQQSIKASGSQIVTVSIGRQDPKNKGGEIFWQIIKNSGAHILPNTAGCRSAQDAIVTAEMAREIFETHWIKLEVIGDDYNLQPDPVELIHAAKVLVEKGFEVFPYCTDDLVLCKRLADAGCSILMPWASPIGSGKGILNPYALQTIRERLPDHTLIVDAGIGTPSDATQAFELGYDAVLVNSAVALAHEPAQMAEAFKYAVMSGRKAFEAGRMPVREFARPSTPVLDTPFWQQETIHD